MVESDGKVKAKVITDRDLTHKRMRQLIRENIEVADTTLMTDESKAYLGISSLLVHQVVNHQEHYVDGDIHTNNVESFWALLKRGIVVRFHKVGVKHLPKYIAEFCYRHNNRNHVDLFQLTLSKSLGV